MVPLAQHDVKIHTQKNDLISSYLFGLVFRIRFNLTGGRIRIRNTGTGLICLNVNGGRGASVNFQNAACCSRLKLARRVLSSGNSSS